VRADAGFGVHGVSDARLLLRRQAVDLVLAALAGGAYLFPSGQWVLVTSARVGEAFAAGHDGCEASSRSGG
jgi:hypothetical protein